MNLLSWENDARIMYRARFSTEIGLTFAFYDRGGYSLGLEPVNAADAARVAVAAMALPLILAGVPPPERESRVRAALAATGLSDRARHRPDQLSGGQRQRVAIARATIMRPRVILADEPTGNLDRASGKEVLQSLESLNREGITLILVTHDPDLGNRAPRKLQMVDGRISGDTGPL